MTTVVFDGKHLASDSRGSVSLPKGKHPQTCECCKENISGYHVTLKKLHTTAKPVMFEGSRVIGMAGAGVINTSDYMRYLIETHPEPVKAIKSFPSAIKSSSTDLLIVTEQKAWLLSSHGVLTEQTKLPVAIGSGQMAALLALKLGKTAMEAVGLASSVDNATDTNVDYIEMVQKETYTVERYVHVSKKEQKDEQ